MENEIIKKGYNQIGEDYHSNRKKRLQLNYEYFDNLLKYLPSSGKLLDLGCGSGVPVIQYFLEKNFESIGVDISEKMIEIAIRELPQANFKCIDMLEYEFPKNTFDLIISTYAIIHVKREKQSILFSKIYNSLKKGGKAYLVLGNEDIKSQIKDDWHGVKMYWSFYSPKQYVQILKKIGFNIIWSEIEDLPNGEQFFNVILKK